MEDISLNTTKSKEQNIYSHVNFLDIVFYNLHKMQITASI